MSSHAHQIFPKRALENPQERCNSTEMKNESRIKKILSRTKNKVSLHASLLTLHASLLTLHASLLSLHAIMKPETAPRTLKPETVLRALTLETGAINASLHTSRFTLHVTRPLIPHSFPTCSVQYGRRQILS